MSAPTIVLATHEFFPVHGGIGVYVRELAAAATRVGYDVRVVAPRHPQWAQLETPMRLVGLPDARWAGEVGPLAVSLWHFLKERRRLRCSALHICQQGPLRIMMALRLAGLVKPARLIVTLHGSELMQLSARAPGRRWLGALLARTDRIMVLSEWVREEVGARFPDLAPKTVVAAGAPRCSIILPSTRMPRRQGRLVILCVGRIHPRKGQAAILRAIARLDEESAASLRVVMVGPVVDGTYARELRRLAKECAAEVDFTGEVEDERLARHYQEADVFALTSQEAGRSVEGFGLVYLEASASGLPVLAHRTGGVESAVQAGVTGLLVDPGDEAGLVCAIRRLVEDADLRRRLGENGQRFASGFSWDACARATYDGLFEASKLPGRR